MTSAPREVDVSVIIPAWRASGFVGKAVRSALASEGAQIEVVVVDDASPDDTYQTLLGLAEMDPRIRAFRLERNGGPSAARNLAIEKARGRWCAVLDADDTMQPDRLAKLSRLGETREADIVVDNMLEVDESGARLGEEPFLRSSAYASERRIDLAEWVSRNHPMKPGDCLGYLKPLFRRETLLRTGLRYDTALRNSEDYYLVADLLAANAVMIFSPSTGYLYQRAVGSISHRLRPEHTAAWLAAEQRFLHRMPEGGLPRPAQSELRARLAQLRKVDHMVRTLDAISKRRVGALTQLLAMHPQEAPFTLGWLARIARERVSRKLAPSSAA